MNRLAFLTAVFCLLGLFIPAAPAAILAQSRFGTNKDEWDTIIRNVGTSDGEFHVNSGGNPGGYLSVDTKVDGETTFWVAPDEFLGNKSAAYGGTLSFDLRVHGPDTDDPYSTADVILRGGGITLIYNLVDPPKGNTWHSFNIKLDETSPRWHFDDIDGRDPTQDEFQTVLGNINRLWIRGEYLDGPDSDSSDLDNVVMTSLDAVPEPSSLILLGLGAAGLVGYRWRRKRMLA